MTHAYYNENDEFAADWLRNLIKAGLIADGEVDTRSIVDVRADDVRGFAQCHFFAGIGGWSYALRKAGWDDNRPAWTGSCPCQPFSLAGAQQGFADERHLWPVWRDLVEVVRPPIVFGEQVASATKWLGLVRGDLEALGYAVGALPIQAAGAGANHIRDRYWFVANSSGERRRAEQGKPGIKEGARQWRDQSANGGGFEWVIGADRKSRRVKPGVRLLAHGVPARVGKLRGFGNAIDPRPAAAFIAAARDAMESGYALASHKCGVDK